MFLLHSPINIIKLIRKIFYDNQKEILLSLAILLFVIPIVYSLLTDWEVQGFFIFYDFIFGLCFLIWLIGLADNREYEREGGGYNGYQGYNNTNKTYGYNNPNYHNSYYNPINREKERNGGFTDKEVQTKKQLIRKKLEKRKLLEISEKIKDEQVVG